jgi:hypothetical protein
LEEGEQEEGAGGDERDVIACSRRRKEVAETK